MFSGVIIPMGMPGCRNACCWQMTAPHMTCWDRRQPLVDGTAAVGAPGSSGGTGAVYIYGQHAGGSNRWRQVDKLLPDTIAGAGALGTSLAMSADVLVAGAPESAVGGFAGAGAVLTFDVPAENEAWGDPEAVLPETPVEVERFGASLALDDFFLAAGVPGCTNAGVNAGCVRIYGYSAGPALVITDISFEGANVCIEWSGGTNLRQIVEGKTAVSDADWQPLCTNEPPTPVKNYYEEPVGVKRFYRIRAEAP